MNRCTFLTCSEPAVNNYCQKHTLEVVANWAQRILQELRP